MEIEKIINSDEYKLSNIQKNKLDRKMSTANVVVAVSSDSLGSNVGDFSYSKTDYWKHLVVMGFSDSTTQRLRYLRILSNKRCKYERSN